MISMIDVQNRKFIASTCNAKPYHEARFIPGLHKNSASHCDVLVLDKGFDAEWLHQWLNEHGTFSVAPARKKCRRGRHRKLMRDCMDWCLYWQRNIVESLFSALKRLFGGTVRCQNIRTQTAELFCSLIAYNIGSRLTTFSTEPAFFYSKEGESSALQCGDEASLELKNLRLARSVKPRALARG